MRGSARTGPATTVLLRRSAPVVLALILAGCSGGADVAASTSPTRTSSASGDPSRTPALAPTPSVPATTVPGGTVVTKADAGFTLTLPPGWQEVPLDPGDLATAIATARQSNPTLAAALEQQGQRALQSGGKLFATQTKTHGATNVNLIEVGAADATLKAVVKASTQELAKAGATDIQRTPVTVPAGPAMRVTFTLPVNNSAGHATPLQDTQYYLLHDGMAYVLTFTTTNRAVNESAVRIIVSSLRFT